MSDAYSQNYQEIQWLPIPQHEPQPIRKARSRLPGPMVITDTIEPTKSMLDGRTYTSKSALRRTYREAGVTEVGNETQRLAQPPRKPDRKGVEAAVGKAFSRAGLGAP